MFALGSFSWALGSIIPSSAPPAKEVGGVGENLKKVHDYQSAAAAENKVLKPDDVYLREQGLDVEIINITETRNHYYSELVDDDEQENKLYREAYEEILYDRLKQTGYVMDGDKNKKPKSGKSALLGKGGYGAVYRMIKKGGRPGELFAVKICKKIKTDEKKGKNLGNFRKEIEPFIYAKSAEGSKHLISCVKAFLINIEFKNAVETSKTLSKTRFGVIIMDFCQYSLKGVISERRYGEKLTEKLIASWFYGMAKGLEYLHSNKIAHRDIKPDNVLLKRKPTYHKTETELKDERKLRNEFEIKLVDYGISKTYGKGHFDEFDTSKMGTSPYMAPEMFRGADERLYEHQPTDIWALGVTVWELIHFERPFASLDYLDIDKINIGHFCTVPRVASVAPWSNIERSPPLLEILLKSCLALDVDYRFTASQIVDHVYFDILDDSPIISD